MAGVGLLRRWRRCDQGVVCVPGSVTLQVSVTPWDEPHLPVVLPHQLRQLGDQVSEVLLNVDLHRSEGVPSQEFARRWEPLRAWLDTLAAADPRVRVVEVDYSPAALQQVSEAFFGGVPAPVKDFRGRPIHAYLSSLLAAAHDWVLHLDSDMLLGGGGKGWVGQAQTLLEGHPQWVVASPLPGPPRSDGTVLRQPDAVPLTGPEAAAVGPGFTVGRMSSRVFLTHVPTLTGKLCPLPLTAAPMHGRLWTWREHNPPYEKVENIIGARMAELGLARVDLLGASPGLWSLHPPFRSARFYDQLPALVAAVEAGEVPDAQRGDYDVNDSMLDWTDARRAIRRQRVRTMLGAAR